MANRQRPPHIPADEDFASVDRTGAVRETARTVLRALVTPRSQRTLWVLPPRQLQAALDAANTRDLVIAVAMDRARRHVILYRGTLDALAVSYDWFTGYRTGSRLVFTDVTVCDYGQTLRIGHYEVAVDALLYDHDAEYRQQAKARALMVDDTFGGSVRRLRLARGIARHAIPGVTDKTMARIERNEVRHPHIQTLRALANALSVDETELGTY